MEHWWFETSWIPPIHPAAIGCRSGSLRKVTQLLQHHRHTVKHWSASEMYPDALQSSSSKLATTLRVLTRFFSEWVLWQVLHDEWASNPCQVRTKLCWVDCLWRLHNVVAWCIFITHKHTLIKAHNAALQNKSCSLSLLLLTKAIFYHCYPGLVLQSLFMTTTMLQDQVPSTWHPPSITRTIIIFAVYYMYNIAGTDSDSRIIFFHFRAIQNLASGFQL